MLSTYLTVERRKKREATFILREAGDLWRKTKLTDMKQSYQKTQNNFS